MMLPRTFERADAVELAECLLEGLAPPDELLLDEYSGHTRSLIPAGPDHGFRSPDR